MRIRVLYEVTVDGAHYVPGIVEVKGAVGLDLLREHRGNFEAVTEEPKEEEDEIRIEETTVRDDGERKRR